jgi:hypothetical protein
MENDKEDYKRKEERRKIREVKEWKNLSNDEIDKIILLREWISGKSAKNNENYCFPEHLNIKKVEYCNYCSPYFQELEIKRLNKVSIKEWYEETVSQETFTDFVDNSEKWHQRQLAEKDKIIESKDKEIYELKLQVKDQKIEELTKQVEELKCLIEQNIKR